MRLPISVEPPADALAGAHAVVHLLGETVNPGFGGRWTEAKKASIMSSRVLSTRNLVRGLKGAVGAEGQRPALICGSAIGWYGERGSDERLDAPAIDGVSMLARFDERQGDA